MRSLLMLGAVLCASACSSGAAGIPTSSRADSSVTAEAGPTSEAPVPSEPLPAFSAVGTYVVTSTGTRTTTAYSFGAPVTGTNAIPAEVLNACSFGSSAMSAQMAFIPGEVTVAYDEGSLPLDFTFWNGGSALAPGTQGQTTYEAVNIGGTWYCDPYANSSPLRVTLQPKSSVVAPIWLLAAVLSNTHPRIGSRTFDQLFVPPVLPDTQVLQGTTRATGPGAVKCSRFNSYAGKYENPAYSVMVVQRPPYHYTDTNADVSCVLA